MSERYVEPELVRPRGRDRDAYLFLAPALALLALFFAWPIAWLVSVSLTDYDPVASSAHTVGLTYYRDVLSSPAIWRAILIMAYFGLIYVPVTLGGACLLALLLRRGVAGSGVARALLCAPCAVPVVAAALIWRAALEPIGALDRMLYTLFGFEHGPGWAGWLAQPYLATPCIALFCAWRDVGFFSLLFAAAFARVPDEAAELARLDGASRWQVFRHITIPASGGTLGLALILLIINVQNVFQEIYVMTEDGGPANWSVNVPFLIFRHTYWSTDWGRAAALSLVLFAVTVVVILIQNRMLNRRLGWS